MKNTIAIVVLSVLLSGMADSALAEGGQSPAQAPPASIETVELRELLEVVAKKSGKEFLVDRRVPAEVVLGTIEIRDVDYAVLNTVLRNNGLAAAPSREAIRVVPVAYIRQYELPIVSHEDQGVPDDAWVTRILKLKNTAAARLVPLLRPLLPQAGHLVADADSNLLIVVAPFGMSERIASIVEEVDVPAIRTQESTR